MNNIDKQYQALLQYILDNGVTKQDRTGTGTISVFGRQIRHNMKDGFPLLTTKKMAWKTLVTELIWFLKGDTNIKFLVDNGCHIWDGDAYKNFVKTIEDNRPDGYTRPILTQEEFIKELKHNDEFAKKWGELGPVYGKQWRSWKKSDSFIVEDDVWKNDEGWCSLKDFNKDELYIDQIANLIRDLKTNPDSRRLMVSAWNVSDLDQMVLPPCHYGFQVYTRELSDDEKQILLQPSGLDALTKEGRDRVWKENNLPNRAISLMWNQRSVDTFLGLPFNIASYGLLLEIIAKAVNMVPDELIGNLGDVHLYSNHIEQAKEQIGRKLIIEERVRWAYDRKLIDYVTMVESEELDRLNVPTHTRQPYPLPTLNINTEFWQTESGECGVGPLNTNLKELEISDFTLENYQSHPTIKAPLSN